VGVDGAVLAVGGEHRAQADGVGLVRCGLPEDK